MTRSTSPEGRDPGGTLSQWREELARLYEDGDPATVQGRHLLPFIRQFSLPQSAFEDLIDGVAMDLERLRYDTFEVLRQYCLRVASAVGLICVEIFGYSDLHTRDYAIDLGIALQLTNIIRDVPVDMERGRVYIPTEDLKRFRMHRGRPALRRRDRQPARAAGLSSRARQAVLSKGRGRFAATRRAAA